MMNRMNWWWVVLALLSSACEVDTKNVEACGDGFIDPGEQCDTDTGDTTCASLGHYNATGVLRCSEACQFDVDECGGRCGDGIVDAPDGETCDGANLQGASCLSLGYYGGTLTCGADCRLAIHGCELFGRCDDGVLQTTDGEVCDGENFGQTSCESLGYHGGALACAPTCLEFDVSDCVAVGRCGDGILQAAQDEDCDGDALDGKTCEFLGYHGGELACSVTDCSFDRTDCEAVGACGDGILQSDYGEFCDGSAFGEMDCTSLGYYGGQLGCTPDCALDPSGCESHGRCGDNVIQIVAAEVCEAGQLGGATCESLGYHGGALACGTTCLDFDVSDCEAVGRCGDGVVQAGFGEVCDGTAPAGQTCLGLGYYGGSLLCSAECTLDLTDCLQAGRCGDGINQGGSLEDCDGFEMDGTECISLGYHPGVLACSPDCRFDPAGCDGRCGDGLIQGAYEDCDLDQLGGSTCVGEGLYPGTLSCDTGCALDLSGCGGRCGDGVIQDGFGEVCDGAALAGAVCLDEGQPFGAPSCTSLCGDLNYDSCRSSDLWGNNWNNSGIGVALDASGAVYVAGRTDGSLEGQPPAGSYDASLTKYSSQGSRLWTRQWGTISSEEVGGLAVDPSGNIYVIGSTEGAIDGQTKLGGSDLFLSKFDPDGVKLWTRLYGTSSTDFGHAVAVDTDGGVFLTGSVFGSFQGQPAFGSYDAFLAKIDANGVLQWVRQWGSSGLDAGRALDVGPAGIAVAGSAGGALFGQPHQGQSDLFVTRFDSGGTRLWTRLLGTSEFDHAWAVVLDASGGLVVAGEAGGSIGGNPHAGGSDVLLARYDADGAYLWARQWGTTGSDGAQGLTLDAAGNILVCGHVWESIDGQPFMGISDGFLSRLDADGLNRTTRMWGSTAYDSLEALALDGEGNLFLTGAASGSIDGAPYQGMYDIWLLFVVP